MERLRHIIPDESYEEQAREYINEHHTYNSRINGVGGLNRYLNDYQGWLEKLESDRNMIPNEERVPADTYYLVRERDNKIVGMLNLRRVLNEHLIRYGGHIGYGIRPTERRQGYNLVNLYLGLLRCQELGLEEVILDCNDDNVESYRTMERLGGIITNTYYDENEQCLVRRYVINVNQAIEEHRSEYEPQIIR
jgi:predicted acetyltransferase